MEHARRRQWRRHPGSHDYVSDADDNYLVYAIPTENPDENGRTLVTNPATFASPNGWHNVDFDSARVHQHERQQRLCLSRPRCRPPIRYRVGVEKLPPSGTVDGSGNLTFGFPIDFSDPPVDYSDAATVNLFYWNNVIHDVLYNYGFKKAGNFAEQLRPRHPGHGGDPVLAEAQDGSAATTRTSPLRLTDSLRRCRCSSGEIRAEPADGRGLRRSISGPMAGFGSLATTARSRHLFLANDGVGAVNDGCEASRLTGWRPDRSGRRGTLQHRPGEERNSRVPSCGRRQQRGGRPVWHGWRRSDHHHPVDHDLAREDGTEIKPDLPAEATLAPNPDLQPDRDSDLDSGVIIHEYGHGVSNRLTGGPGAALCLQNAEQSVRLERPGAHARTRSSDTPTTSRHGELPGVPGSGGVGIRLRRTTDMDVNPSTYQDVIDLTA